MADSQPKKTKRLVKNPETFRERAQKAADEGDKPRRVKQLKQASGKATSPVTKPVGKVFGTVGRFKPIRLLSKVLFPLYFRDSLKELKQVKWPNWSESRRLTMAVLIFAAIFGVSIAIVDYGLDKLFRNILLK